MTAEREVGDVAEEDDRDDREPTRQQPPPAEQHQPAMPHQAPTALEVERAADYVYRLAAAAAANGDGGAAADQPPEREPEVTVEALQVVADAMRQRALQLTRAANGLHALAGRRGGGSAESMDCQPGAQNQ